MCVKIIGEAIQEFDPKQPLENQIADAKEIVVNYDPYDLKIQSFVDQITSMLRKGISMKAEIKFNANNNLDGIRLERRIDQIRRAFDTNEFIKELTLLHSNTDKKLNEMLNMCMGKVNE